MTCECCCHQGTPVPAVATVTTTKGSHVLNVCQDCLDRMQLSYGALVDGIQIQVETL